MSDDMKHIDIKIFILWDSTVFYVDKKTKYGLWYSWQPVTFIAENFY